MTNTYDSSVYAALMADASAHHTERTAFDSDPRGFAIIEQYRSDPAAAVTAFREAFTTESGNLWRERTVDVRALAAKADTEFANARLLTAYRCPECGRAWTVLDDPNEWAYGHDCEA
jgi:hypothetical protein